MGVTGKYMRAKDLRADPILEEMPGPWGQALRYLRAKKGVSRESIAKRARMTPTTYGRIERGQHTQTRKLQDLADLFEVPIEDVLQLRTSAPTFSAVAPTHDEVRALRARVDQLSRQVELLSSMKSPEPSPKTLDEAIGVLQRSFEAEASQVEARHAALSKPSRKHKAASAKRLQKK